MSEALKITAIIVDDSERARNLLRLMLNELAPIVQVMGVAEDAEEGLRLIDKLQPDALFLDIEMPGKSGLQLAEALLEKNFLGNIVFTTAYNEYALKAFRLSAIDYLLKPIQEDQLLEAVEKLKTEKEHRNNEIRLKVLSDNLKEDKNDLLCIPIQGGFEYLALDEIEYFVAEGSYIRIVCLNQKPKIVSKNLKYFETVLDSTPNFVRTHRSYLVNMKCVQSYSKSEGGLLRLKSSQNIPISRERKQGVLDYLK